MRTLVGPQEGSGTHRIVETFQHEFALGDYAAAREIFNQHNLLIWYGVGIETLGEMLDTIVSSGPETQDEAFGFQVFLSSAREQRYFEAGVLRTMRETSSPSGIMMRFGYLLDLRLRGLGNEALALFDVLRGDLSIIQPFTDRRNGWPQFLSLQQGITAMLAGHFQRALHHFTETLARSAVPGLELLHRNALVRSALIEAAFGNPESAQLFYERAQRVPRTSSWAEASLDASAALVQVLLEPEPQVAGRKLAVLDLAELGEMWPFFVFADYIVHDRAAAHARISTRLENLSSLPFAREGGEGFSGSVIPLAKASHKLYSGATLEARDLVKKADPDHLLTKLVTAMVELRAGNPQVAARITSELRDETVELRRAELWRISLGAQAQLLLGSQAEMLVVLREVENLFQPLRPREVNFFTNEIAAAASEAFDWWPRTELDHGAYFERLPDREELITEREKEVLKRLAMGHTRPQIAEELFITLNTLKTQLRSLYRKLGASSRAEALQKASKRGLL